MISDTERDVIIRCARKFGASRVVLFGSCIYGETMLKRVFKHHGFPLPDSQTWHKDLLVASHERGIIARELVEALDEYRAFRHFFVHGYGILLDEHKLLPLAERLHLVWELRAAIYDVELTYGVVLSILFLPHAEWEQLQGIQHPLWQNISRDGIEIE